MKLYLPTHKLQVVLGAAKTTNDMTIILYYDQINLKTNERVPNLNLTITTNGLTVIDLLGPPLNGYELELKECEIYNADTAIKDVIIKVTDGINTNILHKEVALAIASTVGYSLTRGWG